mmetsp:Transcript_69562/g.182361  ORF Transcript_69562/g.182361 Transcript_69562/m.182361 type:complete len:234 (+) Transcript_69562:1044-1745(+)
MGPFGTGVASCSLLPEFVRLKGAVAATGWGKAGRSRSSSQSRTMSSIGSFAPSAIEERRDFGEHAVESSLPSTRSCMAQPAPGCHFSGASETGSRRPGKRGFCAVMDGSASARMSPGTSQEASNFSRRRRHSQTLKVRKSSQPSSLLASSPCKQFFTVRDVWALSPDIENVGGNRSHASAALEDGDGHTRRISLQDASVSPPPSRTIADPARTETKALEAWVEITTTKGLPRK